MAKQQRDQVCPVSGQTPVEDFTNVVSHGISFILCLPLTLFAFWPLASERGFLTGFWIFWFGLTLTGMFGTSTVYHLCRCEKRKRFIRGWDHAFIYFLIAASYGVFLIAGTKSTQATALTLVVVLACLSLAVCEIRGKRFNRLIASVIYLCLGGSAVLAYDSLLTDLSAFNFSLLLSGLLSYAFGVYFYLKRDLAFHHFVWHLLVMVAAVFHGTAVLNF